MEFATTLRMDVHGRIIIPAKLRTCMGLQNGSILELVSDGRDIRLRKCTIKDSSNKFLDESLEALRTILPCGILLCDETSILISKNIYVTKGTPITQEITELLLDAKERTFEDDTPIYPIENTRYPLAAFFPLWNIHNPEKKTGLLLCKKNPHPITDMELGAAKMVAATITNHRNK